MDPPRLQHPGPVACAEGEISVKEAAARLGCSTGVIYYWIDTGQLDARRSGNRLCIPWTPDTEAECRARIEHPGTSTPQPARPGPENAPLPR